VFSTRLPSSEQSGHTVYDSSKSSTYKVISGATWDISYADGSGASGIVGTETVKIGDASVTSQAVELATSASSSFVDSNNDGLLGLAFSSLNTVSPNPQKTFYDNIKSSLADPVFAVDLKHGSPGSYDFGFIDSSKYSGSITYVTVDTSQGFWEFTASGYAIGSGSTRSSSIDAIAGKCTSSSDVSPIHKS
jgi:Eukaryotic aspartyl protease